MNKKKQSKGENAFLAIRKRYEIPTSKNRLGYSSEEIKQILSKDEFRRFNRWFYGQTAALDNEGNVLVYEWDLLRFIGFVRRGIPTMWD